MKILSVILKTLKILGAIFVFLLLVFSCICIVQQNNDIQKMENKLARMENENTQYSNRINHDIIIMDELLRKIYANEISLADTLITKLEDYYSQNNKYPNPEGFIYADLEKEIANKSEKIFYYTWLDWHYLLIYELPNGTGLIYFSETKSWTITENLP
jgi:cell division protein FtsL